MADTKYFAGLDNIAVTGDFTSNMIFAIQKDPTSGTLGYRSTVPLYADYVITEKTYAGLNTINKKAQNSINEINNKFFDMGEPNGIVDKSLSTISFINGTRTFSINPTGTNFDCYQDAVEYTVTGNSKIIDDIEGLHLIYYDATTLSEIINPTNAQISNITLNKIILAYIYWDKTNQLGKLMEERHGITMDGATHLHLHFSIGTQYQDGLALGDFLVDQDGSLDSHAQFSTASGIISDEDIQLSINAITSTTGLEIWYLDGTDWRWTTNAGFSVRTAGTGRLAYNNSGIQTEVTNNSFVLCHVFAWNATDQKPITIQGQNQYGNIPAAREGAQTEIANLILSGLPSPEMKPIGTVIFQTSDTYTNAVKGRVRSTDTGEDYVDFRKNPLNTTVTASDHGQLAGLVDDDHLQYLNINGRSGGQIAYGGTGASEDLTFDSTLHATKGSVISKSNFSVDTGKAYQFNKVDFMSAPGTNNVCIGFNTNGSITTAQDSVFVGTEAGDQTTTGSQNVYIGYQAGKSGVTAQFNVAIGYQAGYGVTNASNNVFIGNSAGRTVTTGTSNVFIGVSAGLQTTIAGNNVAIGYHAGRVNNANNQIFIGYEAGKAMLSGADNVFIGNQSGNVATTTADSVLIGSGSGVALTTGNKHIIIGKDSGAALTTQNENVFVGYESGKSCISSYNTLVGVQAGRDLNNATAILNTFIGYQAGIVTTTAQNCTIMGAGSAASLTTGNNNTLIGVNSGAALTTQSGNVFIGHLVGQSATVSNKLYIDNSNTATPLIEGDFSTNALKINGTLEVTGKLTVGGAIDPTALILDAQASAPSTDDGTIYYDSGATEFKFRENGVWRDLAATGLWTRSDTTLSPTNSGDSVEVTGNNVNIYGTTNPALRISEGGSANNYTFIQDAGEALSLIRKVRATAGDCEMQIDAMPASTSNAYINLFRNTNTSANVSLNLYKGDGTITKNIVLDPKSIKIGLGTATPQVRLDLGTPTANTRVVAITSAGNPTSGYFYGFGTANRTAIGYLDFHATGNLTATYTDGVGMCLSQNKFLGIGALEPAANLHIKGSDPDIRIQDTANDVDSYAEIQDVDDSYMYIRKYAKTGAASIDIDAMAIDTTSLAAVRLFRYTNTGGTNNLEVFKGDATNTPTCKIYGKSGSIEIISTAARYTGDFETDGSWRSIRSGNDFVFQRRESATWVTKSTISA